MRQLDRHSAPYSAETSTEGLVCDRGEKNRVECRIGKTRGNGSVLLQTIVAYGEP